MLSLLFETRVIALQETEYKIFDHNTHSPIPPNGLCIDQLGCVPFRCVKNEIESNETDGLQAGEEGSVHTRVHTISCGVGSRGWHVCLGFARRNALIVVAAALWFCYIVCVIPAAGSILLVSMTTHPMF